MRKLVLVALLAGCPVFAQQPTPPAGGTAGAEYNGLWAPASIRYDGQEMMPTAESREKIRLSVSNGVYSLFFVVDPKEGTGQRLATAKFDVDAKAGTFALTFQGGPKNGQKVHGVLELKGDELRLCYTPDSNPRPTAFDAAKGTDTFCETWKRLKK